MIKDTGGTLSLGTTTGLTFVSGANNSMQMVVQGTLANINAALAKLTYTLSGKSQTITMVYTNLATGAGNGGHSGYAPPEYPGRNGRPGGDRGTLLDDA